MKLNYFNFKDFGEKLLLTNDWGRYAFIDRSDFKKLIAGELKNDSAVAETLLRSGMIYDDTDLNFSEKNRWGMLDAKSYLATATSLHIFVVTTACNLSCVYCQANNGTTTPNCFMDQSTAERAVNIALQSPAKVLSFEFQGGEPLLNYTVIKHIIEYAEEKKGDHIIEYNIVSNLTLITDEILEFFSRYNVSISTSVDGNEFIHNSNRPFKNGDGSFDKVKDGIDKVRSRGMQVGAIETTTRYTLPYYRELIDTYTKLGFQSIFIRHLTRLGKAGKDWDSIGYTAEEFICFYRAALDEMIRLNKQGIHIQEQHASILLRRINGQQMNYMELRSPCGGGIGQMAYFADGRVFTCDEGRMLAEMGSDAFLLGSVDDSYKKLISSRACRAVCAASTLETIPTCCDCAYQPYCGTCPVVSYALSGDIIEKIPRSFRCKVYSGMLDYLFGLILEGDPETLHILEEWSH